MGVTVCVTYNLIVKYNLAQNFTTAAAKSNKNKQKQEKTNNAILLQTLITNTAGSTNAAENNTAVEYTIAVENKTCWKF